MTELDIYRDRKPADFGHGISDSLLAEIAGRLSGFAQNGETHVIDLSSLPMSDSDRAALDERLGIGEVRADLAVIGRTEVWETAYAGVWRVRHYGSAETRTSADQVVIAEVPDIVRTHREDARAAALRLQGEMSDSHRRDAANA